ncbi:MAG: RHS repeat domain-containing protein, partial [Thiohalorhabdaceae bacterium]
MQFSVLNLEIEALKQGAKRLDPTGPTIRLDEPGEVTIDYRFAENRFDPLRYFFARDTELTVESPQVQDDVAPGGDKLTLAPESLFDPRAERSQGPGGEAGSESYLRLVQNDDPANPLWEQSLRVAWPDRRYLPVAPFLPDALEPEPCARQGSVIEAQNQAFGETIPVPGTGYALHYRSHRVPGRKAAYEVTIPLTQENVPPKLAKVKVELGIAGKTVTKAFPAEPDQTFSYTWNGRNKAGERVRGTRTAAISVGYVHEDGGIAWRTAQRALGRSDPRTAGVGGWTLSVHHRLSLPEAKVYRGDGGVRSLPEGPGGRAIAGVLQPAFPDVAGWEAGHYLVPSDGGDRVYHFDANGRHRATLDSATGAVRYRFQYDGDGRLTAVVDGHGNQTTLQYDGAGHPATVLSPDGRRTDLATGEAGFLTAVDGPGAFDWALATGDDGLLHS